MNNERLNIVIFYALGKAFDICSVCDFIEQGILRKYTMHNNTVDRPYYSYLPNKRVGPNKRVRWKMGQD